MLFIQCTKSKRYNITLKIIISPIFTDFIVIIIDFIYIRLFINGSLVFAEIITLKAYSAENIRWEFFIFYLIIMSKAKIICRNYKNHMIYVLSTTSFLQWIFFYLDFSGEIRYWFYVILGNFCFVLQ